MGGRKRGRTTFWSKDKDGREKGEEKSCQAYYGQEPPMFTQLENRFFIASHQERRSHLINFPGRVHYLNKI